MKQSFLIIVALVSAMFIFSLSWISIRYSSLSSHTDQLAHVVLLRFDGAVDESQKNELFTKINSLSRLETVDGLITGQRLSNEKSANGFHAGLIDLFNNTGALSIYNSHPYHIKIKQENILPLLEKVEGTENRPPLLSMDLQKCRTRNGATRDLQCSYLSSGESVAHFVGIQFSDDVSKQEKDQFCRSVCDVQKIEGVLSVFCSKNVLLPDTLARNQEYEYGLVAILRDSLAYDQFLREKRVETLMQQLKGKLNPNNQESLISMGIQGGVPCSH